MRKIVVLTGAGISAESGIKTFRDDDGLWKKYRFEYLASPQAWADNPELVLEFYNMRRKNLLEAQPNAAHHALKQLEEKFDVEIITQNVDDLHERAGSSKVLHLHGELRKARSTSDENLVYDIDGWELKKGDKCEKGSQLRPHVVWFGEMVPNIEIAAEISRKADVFIVIGTSLVVYPAAGLLYYVPSGSQIFLIDPKANPPSGIQNLEVVREKASSGVPKITDRLLKTSKFKYENK